MPILGDFPSRGGENINNAQIVKALAADRIQIGDVVYAVKNDSILKTKLRYNALDSYVYTATLSPDGKTLVLGGGFSGFAKVYSVDGTNITYISDIYKDSSGTALDNAVNTATFSPDGKTLILGKDIGCAVYSVNGTNITYVSDIYADNNNTELSNYIYTATFSPDGKTLILGGNFTGYAKIYSVDGTNITYVSDIYADNNSTILNNTVYTTTFSPDGKVFVLGGSFTGYAKIYSINNTNITYISDIHIDDSSGYDHDNIAAFSPDGKIFILGGNFTGKAKVYSVDGTNITYVSDIQVDFYIETAAFSPDGKTLILGKDIGGCAVYSVDGTNITYISDIQVDSNDTGSDTVRTATLSPDGKTLVLGGNFIGYAKVYSVDGTNITYVSNIYADNGTTNLNDTVNTVAFSPDGKTLVLGGDFTGYAKIYSVDGTNITYVSDIYADNNGAALSNYVDIATFSPDGKTLILGGRFADKAKIYSVDGTNITYIDKIYANNVHNSLNSYVYTAAFSPDGKTLVLGGRFTGRAKVYSVNSTNITYVSDIYADSSTGTLNSYVYASAFSPDGKTLVLGGYFSGRAKIYSVNGTNITYVSNIYADSSTDTLNSYVYASAFSPDGKTLVLGGQFSGKAKIYSVDGTNITYVSDIYKNNSDTTVSSGSVKTAIFSPDGKTLILGKNFAECAKIYSVNGTNITFVSDIYEDNNTVLNGTVSAATFSPNGKTLVLGGAFTNKAIKYWVNDLGIFIPLYIAYPAIDNKITQNKTMSIGFSEVNIEVDYLGEVELIVEIEGA